MPAASATQDTYRNVAHRLVEGVTDDVRAYLDVTALKFGGNLDAAKIRHVCELHGVSHRTSKRTKGGEKLSLVKNKRNALAHGDTSFVECGRDYTVTQLGEIQRESVLYVKAILRNIESFTKTKTYRT